MDAEIVCNAAADGDHVLLYRLLEEQPALVCSTGLLDMTVLHHAARSGSAACVQRCLDVINEQPNLDLLTEINRTSYTSQDTLTFAVSSGRLDCVKLLVDAGVNTDYSTQYFVAPLHEAVEGSNSTITQYLLENLKIDYSKLSEINISLWFSSLGEDLYATLDQFNVLKWNDIPYHQEDFEQTWARVISKEPDTPGIEEFIMFICQDAVERWTLALPVVMNGLVQMSEYCLSHLVCHKQSMRIVNQMRYLGVFFPPDNLPDWRKIFHEWGVVRCPRMTDEVQQRLIEGLAGLITHEPSEPIVDDPQMLASILFLAVLASRFPNSDWLQYWQELCEKAGIPQTSCTLQRLLESYGEGSYVLAFWHKIFVFVLSRTLLLVQCHDCPSDYAEVAFQLFIGYALESVPTIHPKELIDFEFESGTLLFDLWAQFYTSKVSIAHPIFINFCREYLFPWLPLSGCVNVVYNGLPISNPIELFFDTNFLEVCLDFYPELVLRIIKFYAQRMIFITLRSAGIFEEQIIKFWSLCILAITESSHSIPTMTTVTEFIDISWPISYNYSKKYLSLTALPFTLFRLAKSRLRICLRTHIDEIEGYPKVPLSHLVNMLHVSPGIKEAIIQPFL